MRRRLLQFSQYQHHNRFSTSSQSLWIDSKSRFHFLKEEYLHLNTRVKKKWVDIISWNILGPNEGENDHYSYSSTLDATSWRRREERIINHLLLLRPTIICLQELSYESISSPQFNRLAEAGYACAAFAPSTTEDPNQQSHSILGCGIFVQQEKIDVLSSHRLTLSQFAPLLNCKVQDYSTWIKKKPQSMAVCHLVLKATNQRFYLGNTRLCPSITDPDVRALQTQSIVNCFTALLKQETEDAHSPVVLCGDFSAEPFLPNESLHPAMQSRLINHKLTAPFHILNKGSLPTDHPEHPDTWSSRVKRTQSPELGMFITRHPHLLFSNIYQLDSFREHQPLWTTKTSKYQGWVDHIWVTSDVKVRRILSPLVRAHDPKAEQTNSSIPAIPTKTIPSDHIPVGCVISFRPPQELIDQTQDTSKLDRSRYSQSYQREEEEEIS